MALKHKPAKGGKQAYSIQIDGSNRPIALIGRVQVTVTKGRGLPPAPHCGFTTDFTPFDRGHIMALELGALTHNAMPLEDRTYWQNQQIGLATQAAYDTYVQVRKSDIAEMEVELTKNPIPGLSKSEKQEAIDVTRSPIRNEVEFVTTQKPLIAKELEANWGWPPLQTAALDGGRVTQAYLGKPKVSQQKTRKKNHEDYVKKADASKLKMQGYAAVKKVPYQGKGHTDNKPY